MQIRQVTVNDAEKLTNLILQVERESAYMLYEGNERKLTSEQLRKRIETIEQEENSAIFVAEVDNRLAGYLFAMGGQARRTKHSVYIVIGILEQFRGVGIGTKLFIELEKWAKEHRIHRLELSVVTKNVAAINLYKKMGFEIEGVKKHSLCIHGQFVNEYYMAKLL